MKTLGEQWEEIIDGERHMVKAVCVVEECSCKGCCFGYCDGEDFGCSVFACRVMGSDDLVVKDLGIMNSEGFLPDEVTGKYPEIVEAISTTFKPTAIKAFIYEKFDNGDSYYSKCVEVEQNGYPTVYMMERLRNIWNRRN